jgi:phosphatidylglycerophosphatase A
MQTEKRRPAGLIDYLSLALTTFGVGYIPGAPGTYGSAVGVAIYLTAGIYHQGFVSSIASHDPDWWFYQQAVPTFSLVLLTVLCLIAIWASGRSIQIFGTDDPHEAVVDEVVGQLITFAFVPFGIGWPLILTGFTLFRIFDIWKPYPIDHLQNLPGGLGICADDIVAGVYAGICLSVIYAIMLSL